MTIARPMVRGIARPMARPILEGVGGTAVQRAFADGTDGFYFDFSKTDQLFQNLTGTPANDTGENIALALEAHSWQARTLAQQLAVQPELILNGDFSGGTTSWASGSSLTSTAAVVGGALEVTPTVDFGRRVQAITTVAGRSYRITGRAKRVSGSAGANVYVNINRTTSQGDDILAKVIDATDWVEFSYIFRATTATATICLAARTGNVGAFDDISVKEIPGSHGVQATAAAQPKWQTGGIARFDGSDDNLLTTLAPNATAMTLLAKFKVTGASKALMGISGTTTRCFISSNASGQFSGGIGSQSFSTIAAGPDIRGTVGVGALVFGSSTVKLYWNGPEIYSAASADAPSNTVAMALGGVNSTSSPGTIGTFADADIYHALAIKKALTAAEIAAITNQWGTT